MKSRAMYLAFLSLALWGGWAQAALLGEEPLPSPAGPNQHETQPPSADSHGEPSANPPEPAPPEAPSEPAQEGPPVPPESPPQQSTQKQSTQTGPSAHPASAPPKPPVLRHRKPKPAAKSAAPKAVQGPEEKAAKSAAPNAAKSPEEKAVKSAEPNPADPPPGTPSKVVVRNGGAKENSGQIEPGVTTATAQQQRDSTAQLLAATSANLKRAETRQLTKAEQNTMEEIRAYVRQAKMATDRGDTGRAQTLAYKARLLSDDLARK